MDARPNSGFWEVKIHGNLETLSQARSHRCSRNTRSRSRLSTAFRLVWTECSEALAENFLSSLISESLLLLKIITIRSSTSDAVRAPAKLLMSHHPSGSPG